MRVTITSNFRNNMKHFFDYIQSTNDIVVITRPAGREMVLLSLEKYDELKGMEATKGVTNKSSGAI